jgi:hypothetical protein
MKYTTPEIEMEMVDTNDVIARSIGRGVQLNEVIGDNGEVIGQEVVIPDVSILL